MSIYSVGVSALNAAQLGLATAGHNLGNVNTDGYHRQATSQATNIALSTGAGFVGQGVQVDTIKRVYSQFLDSQVLQAQAQGAHLDTYQAEIAQIDNILADPSAGLSPALQDFFRAVNDVAAHPQSVPSRQALLSAASAMVARFQSLDQRLTEIREGVNSQIAENIGGINSLAEQISKVNEQIVMQAGSTSQPPNDLLDLRDNLITQLNQRVRATVVKQGDGSFNVFIGNGQPLVVGQQTFKLAAVPSPEDPRRTEVGYIAGASTVLIPTGNLTGGSLGGLLDFRTTALDPAQNALGRVATALAQSFNDQHRLGQDLGGALGGDFFALPAPAVQPGASNAGSGVLSGVVSNANLLTTGDYRIEVTGTGPNAYQITDLATHATTGGLNDATLLTAIPGITLATTPGWAPAAGDVFTVQPTRYGARDIGLSGTINTTTIAAAAPIAASASPANAGTARVTDSGVTSAAGLPLPADITLTYDSLSGKFVVSGASPAVANIAYTPGTAMTVNGMTLTLTGTPANNDVFTLGNNSGGIADNRNALLLARLQTANTMAGSTTSYQGAYSQLVSQVGNKAAEVQVTAKAEANLLAQAKTSQQALSGVNLDEEAANLLRYQQAYQAAGKMMQIATNIFDTLLQIGN